METEFSEWVPAKELAIREFNSLRGRLCTTIESVGLPKKQEKSLIQMIKSISYQNQAVISELIGVLDPAEQRVFTYNSEKLLNDER